MATSIQLAPGTVFAEDFCVERPLSEGGMGAVYVVEQRSTGKRRALKVMLPHLVGDLRARERFTQEARIGARIQSDHIVEVIGAGIDDATGMPWLAMELLDGQDLAATIERHGRMAPGHIALVFEQLCDALSRAHAGGVVHRDLKPENIFLASPKRRGIPFDVKILDFGISKLVDEQKTAATSTSAIGSPLWMAPEQASTGSKLRPATDVWALGLIGFYLFTGRYFWLSANAADINVMAVLLDVVSNPLVPALQRAAELGCANTLPPGFDAWFARCVARDPSARYPDAGVAYADFSSMLASAGLASPTSPTSPTSAPTSLAPMTPAAPVATQAWNPSVVLPLSVVPTPAGVRRFATRSRVALIVGAASGLLGVVIALTGRGS